MMASSVMLALIISGCSLIVLGLLAATDFSRYDVKQQKRWYVVFAIASITFMFTGGVVGSIVVISALNGVVG